MCVWDDLLKSACLYNISGVHLKHCKASPPPSQVYLRVTRSSPGPEARSTYLTITPAKTVWEDTRRSWRRQTHRVRVERDRTGVEYRPFSWIWTFSEPQESLISSCKTTRAFWKSDVYMWALTSQSTSSSFFFFFFFFNGLFEVKSAETFALPLAATSHGVYSRGRLVVSSSVTHRTPGCATSSSRLPHLDFLRLRVIKLIRIGALILLT